MKYSSTISSFLRSRLTTYAILACIGYICFYQFKEIKRLEKDNKLKQGTVITATRIVKQYVDGNGANHTQIQPKEMTKQQAKNFLENDTYVNDTLVKALNIANNKITELTRINAEVTGESKGKVEDPGNSQSIVKGQDKYFSWAYNPVDTNLDWKYNLDLNIAGYNERKKVFGLRIGDKEYFEDLSSPDKRLTIKGVERYIKPVVKPDFAFRLSIISRYNLTTGSGRVGPNAELDYKRFTVGGSYVYVPGLDRWEWVIEPKFRLVSF